MSLDSNKKYPRTFHVPFSEGATNDDKKLINLKSFLNQEIIFTEKLDGSNAAITRNEVFARSHGQLATHPSFDWLKSRAREIQHLLDPDETIFGEYCYAVHSIPYHELPDYFFTFGIRMNDQWLSQEQLEQRANQLGLLVVPKLGEGIFSTEKDLKKEIIYHAHKQSCFGGHREGLVIRKKESFRSDQFNDSIAKWVRKDHVQSSEHWMHQEIVRQKLKLKPSK